MSTNRIKVLSKDLSTKIAAGEVVERPMAVIKELVENSIDSGANRIIIEIKKGGKELIKVSDNGKGIHPDDLGIAFMRHATSKISTIDDLYSINTLGFRGEALASISAVSRVELSTKYEENEIGVLLKLSGGEEVEKKSIGMNQGTSISVKDLFFNTPARLKFLKSDRAEQSAISDLVNKIVLSHPEVAFKYIAEGKEILQTPGNGKLINTIYSLYERNLSKNLIEIKGEQNQVKVWGYVSNLNYSRGNRQLQNIFVNGRYVKDTAISDSIKLAYKTMLPIGRFPVAFLFIETDPKDVDVNIHPAKIEIKFSDVGAVKNVVLNSIKDKLLTSNQIPKEQIGKAKDIFRKESINIEIPKKKIKDKSEMPLIKKSIPQKNTFTGHIPKSIVNPMKVIKKMEEEIKEKVKDSGFEKSLEKSYENKKSEDKKNTESLNSSSQSIDNTISKVENTNLKNLNTTDNIQKYTSDSDNNKENIIKENSLEINTELDRRVDNLISSSRNSNSFHPTKDQQPRTYDELLSSISTELDSISESRSIIIKEESAVSPYSENRIDITELLYVGKVFNTYLLFQLDESMYIMDQHAAHERILYEKFLDEYKNDQIIRQMLLLPEVINLSKLDKEKLIENKDSIEKLGLVIEEFGETEIVIREIPQLFNVPGSIDLVMEILETLNNPVDSVYEIKIASIIQKSCKNAIKAHDTISNREINQLVEDLSKAENPFTCPHGRPIIISMGIRELEKKFKRIQ
ncbi:MAG: DNA mismatch repair endonuclease MutL [Firmicutes bacterium]|jgi:DNA mismatch repair protein MutL|nr:DNA mismatch repair endonuclease MutL [Bacillota bacterium]